MRRADTTPSGMGVRPARGLLDPRASRGDRAARRLAAAPPVVSVDGVPAADAVGRIAARRAESPRTRPRGARALTSLPPASSVTPIASKRTVSAYGRSVRSTSQRPAILRTWERLSGRTASSGLAPLARARRVFTSQNVEHAAVERDDVELAPARAVVALDDLEAAPDQVLGGELLTALAEREDGGRWSRRGRRWSGGVALRDATPARVRGGSRAVPILRRAPARRKQNWNAASPTSDAPPA